jgi:exonuclease VII small subunit
MANMSYCMFENTCDDLKACVERLEEDGRAVLEESSKYEVRAMASMYDLCKRYMELMEIIGREQYEN